MVSLYQLWTYLSSFFIACTSSIFNAQQCLKVSEYLPAYIADYQRFYSTAPYQYEKDLLNGSITTPKHIQELL